MRGRAPRRTNEEEEKKRKCDVNRLEGGVRPCTSSSITHQTVREIGLQESSQETYKNGRVQGVYLGDAVARDHCSS